jgi:anti-sigma B factor antagonist
VPLSLEHRSIGDVAVVVCRGAIVEGAESAALDSRMRELQELHRAFVLDLHDVTFVDSAGLGLLVRLLARLRGASGALTLCGVAPSVQKSLNVTRLNAVLPSYPTVDAALAAFDRRPDDGGSPSREVVDVLCVHRSADVLAYVRELLRRAGYGVIATTNVADATTFLIATRPHIVVIDGDSRTVGNSGRFSSLTKNAQVVELPGTFAVEEPGEAGRRLLDIVGAFSGRATRDGAAG